MGVCDVSSWVLVCISPMTRGWSIFPVCWFTGVLIGFFLRVLSTFSHAYWLFRYPPLWNSSLSLWSLFSIGHLYYWFLVLWIFSIQVTCQIYLKCFSPFYFPGGIFWSKVVLNFAKIQTNHLVFHVFFVLRNLCLSQGHVAVSLFFFF